MLSGLFFLWVNGLFAQSEIFFRDDFSNNDNNWYLFDNANGAAKMLSSTFYLSHKRKTSSWRYWNTVYVNTLKNFSVEARIKQVKGVSNYGYGIAWGATGWRNSYHFTVSSNGMFSVWGYKNEKYKEFKTWTSNSAIKPMGQYNTLSVSKKGNQYIFYINKQKVYQMNYQKTYGEYYGFVLGRDMVCQTDYFLVKQKQETLDIVVGAENGNKKKNLGSGINSAHSEIAPIISPDGQSLYVARKGHPSNIGTKKEYDVWVVHKKKDGTWGKLQHLGAPINNEGDNLVIAISADGNSMMLEGVYKPDGSYLNDQGISIAHRTNSGWAIPTEIKIKNFYNLNEYESYCPSADRKVLIMSIQRNDAYGVKDLYVSFLQSDGSYSTPKNMGTDINTVFNDGTPFLASDNKTLYFYSYGHKGFGSADIFVSKRLDNTWTNWSKPKNMGSKINSNEWDTYYSVSAKGDYAYVVSAENSLGNEDIFQIKLVDDAKPAPVVLIKGTVLDKKTRKAIYANIVYEDLETKETVATASSDLRTGEYKIILPSGHLYGIVAEAKGYMSISENIDLRTLRDYKEVQKNLLITPIEVGEVIQLNNVFFESASAMMISSSYAELNRLVRLLQQNPSIQIELSGHTQSGGEANYLIGLSEQRVEAVKRYLVNKGIAAERIKGFGYGDTRPIVTSGDLSLNRRVEFKIVGK